MLGAAFLLRAIGDSAGPSGPSWLTWTSPLGWVELTRPFDGQQWWVLALPAAVLAAGVGAAYALAARRDYGAGLLPDRPGRPSASGLLRGPLGLAWRLQRGLLGGWAAGVVCVFAASGAAAKGIGSLLGGSTQLRNEFTRLGGQAAITNAYLAALMLLAGLGAAGYATSAVLRLRTEETGGLAEPLLATAVGRIRWGLSQVAVAVFGAAVLLALAGLAAGLGYGLRTGSASTGPQAARMLGAAMAQLPASLVIAGVAVALVGLAARCLRRRGVDRVRRGGRYRPVRRGSPAIPLAAGHLTVYARPETARRDRVRRAAALAVPGRRHVLRARPGRAAPPRHRLAAPLSRPRPATWPLRVIVRR